MNASQSEAVSEEKIGVAGETFTMRVDLERPLAALLEACGFDHVHFFVTEALESGAIPEASADGATEQRGVETAKFALVPYEHPARELTGRTFEMLRDRGFEPATLRDLLTFALERPDAQLAHDIVALGTMRMRRVYPDRAGESVWGRFAIDHSMCQWVFGLSAQGPRRHLIPVEVFLNDVLRTPARLLVRVTG